MRQIGNTKTEALAKLEAHFAGMKAMAESQYEVAQLDLAHDMAILTAEWLVRWGARMDQQQLMTAWAGAASGAAMQIAGVMSYRTPEALNNMRLMLVAAFQVDLRRLVEQLLTGESTTWDIDPSRRP